MNKSSKEKGIETREIILQAIIDYIKEYGYPPTRRDICDITGIKSTATIQNQLLNMERRGLISLGNNYGQRAIRVTGYRFISEEEIEEIRRGKNENSTMQGMS